MNGKEWAKENLFTGGAGAGPTSEDERVASFGAWIDGLELGEAQRDGDLEIVPLLHARSDRLPFLTVHEAIAGDHLDVTERGGGVVGEVVARNRGRRSVIVFEGETLIGCKQNRVVAHTVLIAPGKSVVIPVGCMEQGRWDIRGRKFRAGTSPMDATLRAGTARETFVARARGVEPKLDQGRLWHDVHLCHAVLGVSSPTLDYHRVIEEREAELRDHVSRIETVDGQVGLVASWRGRLLGIELVGHSETWASLAGRTLTSYVMAGRSLEGGAGRVPRGPRRTAKQWLEALRASNVEARPALGEGTDLELRGPGLVGSALWNEGAPVHLAVFSVEG
jgi:hypothetical protein